MILTCCATLEGISKTFGMSQTLCIKWEGNIKKLIP